MGTIGSELTLKEIGYVRHDAPPETVKEQWATLVSDIEILEQYEEGLTGIDGFSHLFVLFLMNRLRPEIRSKLTVKPRGLLRLGLSLEELPTMGVFACDAPVRPNPIGLSVVELIGRSGRVLTVRGLDAFDGTPVLDIKPYTRDRSIAEPEMPNWHEELLRKTGARRV